MRGSSGQPSHEQHDNGKPLVQHYRDLLVWQKSMQLCVSLYDLTRSYPREELYGLTSQMRRAAVSIMSNIAEGHGRSSRTQLAHFVSIAKGSCNELEAQLLLAQELNYGAVELRKRPAVLCDEVGRMLRAMLRSLQNSPGSRVPQTQS